MTKLAIDGGPKVFEMPPRRPAWPPVYPETAEKLKEIYLGHKWSFYAPREVEFNEKFAQYTGAKHCDMMANGTVTIEVALLALGIGPGDEVIVPAHTWLATGEAAIYVGATPVVVDVEPDTLCMDPAKFEAAITPRTKAVIPVHLFGSMADMDKIIPIARKHGIKIVEDCAHAHGAFWDGKHAGTMGDVGSFSFQESKILASGEGGCCITNDDQLSDRMGRISHIGYHRGAKQGEVSAPPPLGMVCHNYRVTDFQAEILLSQLQHLWQDTLIRAGNAEFLRKRLNAIPGIRVQSAGRLAAPQSYYVFVTFVDHTHLKENRTREDVIAALNAEGLGIGVSWGNLMYRQRLWTIPESMYRIESCEIAEMLVTKELMALSLTTLMCPREDLENVCRAFEKVMEAYYQD